MELPPETRLEQESAHSAGRANTACFILLEHISIIIFKTSQLIVLLVLFSLAEESWNSLMAFLNEDLFKISVRIFWEQTQHVFLYRMPYSHLKPMRPNQVLKP